MSLIEEALRKAQLERPGGRQGASVAVEDSPPRAVPLPRVRPVAQAPSAQPAIPLAAVAGLLVMGMLAWFWLGFRSSPPSAPAPTPAAPAAAPRPVFRRQPSFQLTGVAGGPGEPMAIINGQIVKVGEAVSGAVLLEVGSDSARLRWGDEELVLKTSP